MASACAGARPVPRRGPIGVLPPANLSGAAIPTRELRETWEKVLRQRGVQVIDPAALDAFMARHRVRSTAGVDAEVARASAAELGIEGILVTAVELYRNQPPALAMTARLVSTGPDPAIAWIDGESRTGDESPGLFELGLITDVHELQARVMGTLADSLRAFRDGAAPRARACGGGGRFAPRTAFRSRLLTRAAARSVAVLPFADETRRRGAGEVVALEMLRQLEATGHFRVVEPGVVRDELLRYRIVMDNGVSLDGARVVAELLRTDLVLAGVVRDFEEVGVPRAAFTVMLLDRASSEVLWMASAQSQGDDGVFFFDAGLVATAPALSCRMARSALETLGATAAR